jgi:hypothetical protein
MRSNFMLSLTAIALGFGIAGVSAAPIDFTLQAGTMQANSTTGSLQPPAGVGLNQKGLAAIKPAGGQSIASDLAANDVLSSIAKMGTDNMVRRPDSEENRLVNNLLSGSSKAATGDMVRPPSK